MPAGGQSSPAPTGRSELEEERADQAALAALIRVAKRCEDERLPVETIDAALFGHWRTAGD
jgi:hypothetical protein